PDLLEKVVPTYPVGAKRMLRDNGVWAGALKRDNVQLLTTPITRITSKGIVTEDGVEHEVDVFVYGTGFHASKFLTPMQITGQGGIDLHEHWNGDARAYLGVSVPGFEPVLPLRSEYEHRHQRQHRVLLRVRRAVHRRAAEAALRGPPPRPVGAQGRPRRVQRGRRRGEQAHGVGMVRRQQLVQEREGPRRAELAVHPPRVLAPHPRARSRRLRLRLAVALQADALRGLLLHEPEEVAGDAAHLDLLAALGDAVATVVTVDVLERHVARVAQPAVHLHGAVGRFAAQAVRP